MNKSRNRNWSNQLPQRPKAVFKGYTISDLCKLLYRRKVQPRWAPKFEHSPDLALIYKMLVHDLNWIVGGLHYEEKLIAPWDKVRMVFNDDHRVIVSYRALKNFKITVGEYHAKPDNQPPKGYCPSKAADVVKGDTLLVRYDKSDPNRKVEVQVVTGDLFDSDQDDWRIFLMDLEDFCGLVRYNMRALDHKADVLLVKEHLNDGKKSISPSSLRGHRDEKRNK